MNLKSSLLAACVLALGGCVAPGYDYVQPDYAGAGGYYTGGYYDGSGGYYADDRDGCCDPVRVGIAFGYGYGYPGYYAWGSSPYGYYGYPGYYDGWHHHHHHHGDHDGDDHHHGDHHDHHWDDHAQGHDRDDIDRPGDHFTATVQHWPYAQSRVPVRAPAPAGNGVMRPGLAFPQAQAFSPHIAPQVGPRPDSGAAAHRSGPPPPSWAPPAPPRAVQPKASQF